MRLDKKVNFDICAYYKDENIDSPSSGSRIMRHETSLSDFKNVVKNIVKYVHITELVLSSKGEVLDNKEFEEIVKSSKKDFTISDITFRTNGVLLTQDRAIKIIEAGANSIEFSINAVDKTTYRNVHFSNDFDIVIENFKKLLELKKEKYPKLEVSISSLINIDEDVIQDKFRGLIGENFKLIDRISVQVPLDTLKTSEVYLKSQPTEKCYIPFNELYINSDGSLGLYCKDNADSISFGNLKVNDYIGIYNSREFKSLREMHNKSEFSDEHLCKKCLLYGDQ